MQKFDLIIIGSGPAGKTAAIQGAKLGRKVAIIDGMPQVGGVCVHTGTIPSKTLRETVLNLTGWRERGFYGRSYRAKADIKAADLMQRLNMTLQSEVDILQSDRCPNIDSHGRTTLTFFDLDLQSCPVLAELFRAHAQKDVDVLERCAARNGAVDIVVA